MLLTRFNRQRGVAALTALALVSLLGCGTDPGTTTAAPVTTANSGVLTLVLSSTSLSFFQLGPTPPPAQVIIASNAAALIPSTGIQIGPIKYDDNLHGGWLSVTPRILGLTASVTVRVSGGALDFPDGCYRATFTVKVPGTSNSPIPVVVTYGNGGCYFEDGAESGSRLDLPAALASQHAWPESLQCLEGTVLPES